MRVTDIEVTETARGGRISGTVVWDRARRANDRIEVIYRDIPASALVTPGDAFATAVLLPAIAQREDVTIEAPVSRRLHEGLTRAAEIWKSWMPQWHQSQVVAQLVDRSDLSPTIVAACFSAGVDSFYTVLRPRKEPITTLITLREFATDALLARLDRDQYLDIVERAATGLGLQQIVVESNLFSFCSRYASTRRVDGGTFGGSVLGACVLGLSGMVKRCYVASGFSPGRELVPTGLHPWLDPLWSNEALETVHDGLEAGRDEKIRLLAQCDIALETLSICPQLRSSPGNCRRCDKCIEATFLLARHGALDRCRTLGPLTPEIMRSTIIRPFRLPNFERFPEMTDDPAMKSAIVSALRRSKARRYIRPAGRVLRRLGLR